MDCMSSVIMEHGKIKLGTVSLRSVLTLTVDISHTALGQSSLTLSISRTTSRIPQTDSSYRLRISSIIKVWIRYKSGQSDLRDVELRDLKRRRRKRFGVFKQRIIVRPVEVLSEKNIISYHTYF